jgi:predicted acylesterase/phospholipase RssA
MTYYTHLVISGGGLYGVCMLGVLRYLYIENKLKNVKYVAGNSIGSFFALAYCLNIDIIDLENIIKEIICDENILIDKNNLGNLFIYNGILDLNLILNKLRKYINIKYNINDITFIELSKKFGKNLYISTTNINTGENIIFSTDNYPNVSIFDATCASMTVPYIAIPVKINNEYYVDGALTNNFPLNLFNKIHKDNILGIVIKIASDYSLKKLKDVNFTDFNKRMLEILYINTTETAFIKHINDNDANILIIEDSPIRDFIPFEINSQKVDLEFNNHDIDNLILDGFIKISNYFNKLYNI